MDIDELITINLNSSVWNKAQIESEDVGEKKCFSA